MKAIDELFAEAELAIRFLIQTHEPELAFMTLVRLFKEEMDKLEAALRSDDSSGVVTHAMKVVILNRGLERLSGMFTPTSVDEVVH